MPIRIATFKAVCNQCQWAFSIPLLSDFAYGEFIARGESGKAGVYLNAIEDGNWDHIDELYHQILAIPISESRKESARFQWVIGKCLDPVDGENLSLVGGPVCPVCYSHNVLYGNEIKTGYMSLEDATFRQFSSMSHGDQIEYIRNLVGVYFQAGNN